MKKQNRFLELEGLRGVAAVMVVIYHYLLAFYALAFLGAHSGIPVVQNMRLEDNLYGNPVMVFLSGTFAVAIFFVLSGFVLSIGFFQTGKLEIIKKLAAKRYLRLMIPALVSILIAFTLISIGASHAQQVAVITHSGWLAASWNFIPNFFSAVGDGVGGIFVQGSNGYNNALWTMTTEFFGSFIIFGFLALFSNSPYRRLLYVVLLLITFNTWFMAFIAGMALADLYANGRLRQSQKSRGMVLLVVAGLFLAGYPYGGASGTIYQYITIPGLAIDWKILYLSIGAIVLVAAVLSTERLTAFFRHRLISWLGKYTFSLYLVHLSILYSFTTFVFLILHNHFRFGFNWAVLLAMAVSIPVVALATFMFEKYVDASAIKFSSFIARVLLGEQKVNLGFKQAYEAAYSKTVQALAIRRRTILEEELIE